VTASTVIARARRGTGLTQREAAQRANLAPQTWNDYDVGRVVPSPGKRRELLDALALGARRRDETASLLFVAFRLGGLRLLADRGGVPISFATPEQAGAVASLLAEPPFDRLDLDPVIVPAWHAWEGLPREVRELGEDDGEGASAAVIAAGAIASLLRWAPGWVVA
jgi:hypothetical protein